jgi:arginyl-tRNA synthetase
MPTVSLIDLLTGRFRAAVAEVTGATPQQTDPQVRPAGDPRFGDYQCNAALSLARTLGLRPRELAERIRAAAEPLLSGVCEALEVAGPGFLNARLSPQFLSACLGEIPPPPEPHPDRPGAEDAEGFGGPPPLRQAGETARAAPRDRVGIPPADPPQRVVIDYSSPNIAKQMHVGHLRGTILGDCLARLLEFQGHTVIRQNHVGDWGTQFGILIEYYRTNPLPMPGTHGDVLAAMDEHYRRGYERFQNDPRFAAAARQAVARLQAGEPEALRIWSQLFDLSRAAFNEIYQRLGVTLTDADLRGESFYNDRLGPAIAELREALATRAAAGAAPRGELREDQGALCLFLYDELGRALFRREDGGELPMIVQKSDGAYLYASTDLAALRYRIAELGAQRIIYVVGNEQAQHLQMLFAAGRAAGWAGPDVRLEHAGHGLVLGPDRKRLRTREGRSVRLRELLDEAVQRARRLIDENEARRTEDPAREPLTEDQRQFIAERVGIAALKYADLSRDRTGDYVFDWDTMLAMQGNTAPYMMYAYARIRSIYRRASREAGRPDPYAPGVKLELADPVERTLALRLARFSETLDAVAAALTPHVLCAYLYELAGDFNRFYEACPVLQASAQTTRLSRLRLCDLTARVLRLGLWLLGIEAIERM